MNNKTALRNKAKSIRKTLDIKTVSSAICKKLREQDFYKKAEHVLIFYPLEHEIDLRELLEDKKQFYLPKVNGKAMHICPFDKNTKLERSKFNIQEPCTNPIEPQILDLVIVPALAVDKNGNRLGYGGGFYDTFLAVYKIPTAVVAAKELIFEALPQEEHDIKMDYVITQ